LGNRYGWGGSLHAQDCSGYVRQVYLCFGMELARNTTWQAAMPVRRIDLAGLSSEAKSAILREVPAGAILQFPGHEMLYLGAEGDDFYTINDVSSLAMINDETGKLTKMRGRCVVINGLKDTKRVNEKTWFDELTRVIIPWEKQ
ncbi:MAG: C40 family peptidase, partial [Lachnospiraceae bacterium]|nr:C40 family peptidase [Lachnospiraceae bacterium]